MSPEDAVSTRSRRPDPSTGLAVLAAAAALAVVGGRRALPAGESVLPAVLGVGVGLAVVGTWLVADTPYAFVVGQVGLVVGLDGGLAATPVTQTLLLAVVVVDALSWRRLPERLASYAVAAGAVLALVAIASLGGGVRTAGALVIVATTLVGYAIHRYERVALGLAGDAA